MTREVVLVASLLALMATSAQGKGGVFIVGGDVGSVHHIGGVAKGSRIVVNITAKQGGIDFTCPMKVTLVFLADNNRNGLQRRAFRRNALNSQVIVPSAPISGEAVLFSPESEYQPFLQSDIRRGSGRYESRCAEPERGPGRRG